MWNAIKRWWIDSFNDMKEAALYTVEFVHGDNYEDPHEGQTPIDDDKYA